MTSPAALTLTPLTVYAQKIRPLLPSEAFEPNAEPFFIIPINLAIILLGWAIAAEIQSWHWFSLLFMTLLGLVMAHSVLLLAMAAHDLLHRPGRKHRLLTYILGLLGFALWWMPPSQWREVHNRFHHSRTNALGDPDRNYLDSQPQTWGKWLNNFFVPSVTVHPFWWLVGLGTVWGGHSLRNLSSVLLFNSPTVDYVPAAFKVAPKTRWAIAGELVILLILHTGVLFYLQFQPLKLLLVYFLPIFLGNAGGMFYIYTQHLASPMTAVNDPLVNSVSLKLPAWVNRCHGNFAYHTEHHIFPALNSRYYPLVQELLQEHYPGQLNLLTPQQAWHSLLTTPRHYYDETTLTDATGTLRIPCPWG
jgi:fatty acid desaturase